ncbi:MAG TPA: hypothetical protein VL361_28100 [Candidatus Limnocylindrales bacterium]|nr:hypothetical protein [Candidatus Limnocylindrales bacterium]
MKLWVTRGILLATLIIVGLWGWRAIFPTPERVIRKRLGELAQAASIKPNEGALVKLARSQKVASFFAVDAEIELDLPGRFPQSLSGRDDIMRAVASVRNMLTSLKVECLDISIQMGTDGESGIAHFTGKADLPGESTPQVEELQANFKKIDHEWQIQRITNVRTLR